MAAPSILYEVKALNHLIVRRIEQALAGDSEDNPTGMQGFVLGYIGGKNDEDVFQRDIEIEFNIRPPTVTGILQLMEKNGLIERLPVAYDARLKKLVLTQKAKRSYENIMLIIHGIEKQGESGLTETEIELFRSVLNKIQKNLNQGDKQ